MRWLRGLGFRLRALVARRRMERELDEELAFHLEMEAARLEREGLDPETARRRARARFGSPARQRDRARWSWGMGWLRDARVDARLVGRQLRRSPGFAAGAILTLALGIGANTAIFGVADRALLREPPVLEPGRLAAVYTTCRRGDLRCASSWPDYLDYRDLSRSFAGMAAYTSVPLNLGDEERAARLATGLLVSGDYFSVLGVPPLHGRPIQPADNPDQGGPAQVAVLSHDLWREAFGGDPAVVGRTVRLNGAPFEVVGVAPEGFRGLDLPGRTEVWLPILAGPALGPGLGSAGDPDAPDDRGNRWVGTLVGRLAPETTLAQARAEMDLLAERLGERYPEERAAIGGPRGITVDPVGSYLLPIGSEAALEGFVGLLVGVVALTLLLAAANLANLFLARGTAREREIGVRLAVGAGRGRIVRQLVTESLGLALIGAAAGLAVAQGMLAVLAGFELPGGIRIGDLGAGLDPRVLGFALATAVATALLFGLLPAIRTSRRDLVRSVKAGSTGAAGPFGLRKALVAVQIGLCLVLLVGSGLFLRTLRNSLDADLGFEPEGAVAARFNLSLLGYDEARAQAFVADLLAAARAVPGVTAASLATLVPFQDGGFRGTFVEIPGYVPDPDEELRVDWVVVEPDYFAALGTPVIEGRELGAGERRGSPPAVVINRHMAERYWAGRSPIGSRIRAFGDTAVEVVGVVEDPTWSAVGEEATPFVFIAQQQFRVAASSFLTLVARTDGDPEALLGELRNRFRALDPGLSLTTLRTLEDQVGLALMPQRMGTALLTMLGVLALVLAAVGVYAVVSYSVERRARDIGIRIAIGASSTRVLRTTLADMALPVAAGLALGGLAALALSRTVAAFMFEVSPTDPLTFLVIGVLLAGMALGATWIPARGASRVDPMRVLRSE